MCLPIIKPSVKLEIKNIQSIERDRYLDKIQKSFYNLPHIYSIDLILSGLFLSGFLLFVPLNLIQWTKYNEY
jgi:hypothetical protein